MKLLYLIVPALLFIAQTSGQDSLAFQQYLQQNSRQVHTSQPNTFSFTDSFYQQQLFLVGEIHGYQKAHEFDLALFQHLHQKAGVKHYIAEIDAAQARLFNQYLQTGNEQLLNTVFDYWVKAGMQWGNKDYYQKLQHLYAWNKTLPAREKITILGIDKIQQMPVSIAYFDVLVTKQSRQQLPLADSLYQSLHADSIIDSICTKQIKALVADIAQQPAYYNKTIGNQFFAFDQLVNNLLAHYTGSSREQQFVNNFTAYYQHLNLQQHKLYGFLGFFHTIQDKVNNIYPFAGRLQKSALPLKNHIISFNIIYMESFMMIDATINQMPFPPFLPKNKLTLIPNQSGTREYLRTDILAQDGMLTKIKGSEMFKSITTPNSITLFDMQAATPLLQHYNNFMDTEMPLPAGFSMKMNDPAGMHFQYLVLIRNSDWAAPFLNK